MIINDAKKQSYLIDVRKQPNKSKIVQDSAKLDYILCPHCESYFGILEKRITKSPLQKIRNQIPPKDVEFVTNAGGLTHVRLHHSDILSFHLFWLSILWRCSISTEELFKGVKLEPGFEESLRIALLNYKSTREAEFSKLIQAHESTLPFVRYVLLTPKTLGKRSNGIVAIIKSKAPLHVLALNEYWLAMSNDPADEFINNLNEISNRTQEMNSVKIWILDKEAWDNVHRDQTARLVNLHFQHLKDQEHHNS
ncbi:MAG: hypothetical protein JST46_10485 [Bacteroidetes bacterium]|nr:hypothetical protein [Bacteroidota bacterium]